MTAAAARPAIVFDLAALTTVDTALAAATYGVANRFNIPWNHKLPTLARGLSMPSIAALLAGERGVPVDDWPTLVDALRTSFRALVDQGHLHPQPHADVLALEIHVADIPLAVVSNLARADVEACLRRADLRAAPWTIQCPDDDAPTDAPVSYHRAALDELMADASVSVAVEHTVRGVKAAKAAGLFVLNDPTVKHATCGDGQITAYDERGLVNRLLEDAAAPRLF